MANARLTEAMEIAERIRRRADDLHWCARERYTASSGDIIKGPNELVSLYARPTEVEADDVAAKLEAVIAPLRRDRVLELVAALRADLDALSASDF